MYRLVFSEEFNVNLSKQLFLVRVCRISDHNCAIVSTSPAPRFLQYGSTVFNGDINCPKLTNHLNCNKNKEEWFVIDKLKVYKHWTAVEIRGQDQLDVLRVKCVLKFKILNWDWFLVRLCTLYHPVRYSFWYTRECNFDGWCGLYCK